MVWLAYKKRPAFFCSKNIERGQKCPTKKKEKKLNFSKKARKSLWSRA
jgi:hypothetical protein